MTTTTLTPARARYIASRHSMSVRAYLAKLATGQKRCKRCKVWHAGDRFDAGKDRCRLEKRNRSGEPRRKPQQKKKVEIVLTQAEQAQVERILASRTGRSRFHERDAIDCVVADRRVGEMRCHGGEYDANS